MWWDSGYSEKICGQSITGKLLIDVAAEISEDPPVMISVLLEVLTGILSRCYGLLVHLMEITRVLTLDKDG